MTLNSFQSREGGTTHRIVLCLPDVRYFRPDSVCRDDSPHLFEARVRTDVLVVGKGKVQGRFLIVPRPPGAPQHLPDDQGEGVHVYLLINKSVLVGHADTQEIMQAFCLFVRNRSSQFRIFKCSDPKHLRRLSICLICYKLNSKPRQGVSENVLQTLIEKGLFESIFT